MLCQHHAIDGESIDLLIYAGAIASSHYIESQEFLGNFNYPAAHLQYELGLLRAGVIAICQAGCVGIGPPSASCVTAVQVSSCLCCAIRSRSRG